MDFTAPEYFSTHPDLKNRITHLNLLAEKKGWPSQKTKVESHYPLEAKGQNNNQDF